MAFYFKTDVFVKVRVEELTDLRIFIKFEVFILAKDWVSLGPDSNLLLYWSNPVSQVLRAMAFKQTTHGRSNFGELMTVKIS
jgi:hypothetical protein